VTEAVPCPSLRLTSGEIFSPGVFEGGAFWCVASNHDPDVIEFQARRVGRNYGMQIRETTHASNPKRDRIGELYH
jgi:hypothetical protein